ncbi:MAG: hypothetical protein ANABAC_2678 [Anaerolineae bacterium]|jgi:hypothetical protein|nr:MAG: hypothetical protein ANABAC_2678 [Anaerolineae bacterium]
MLYLPELYYLQDQPDFPLSKAIEITAITVSRWCTCFEARLIAPQSKNITPVQKSGRLPEDLQARQQFVGELVEWLLANSNPPDLFYLLLDDQPLPKKDRVARFDHHDDTCCWVLNLSSEEFAELQYAWQAHGLPVDLFYPEEAQICVPYSGKTWRGRLLRWLGGQKCYTPKQWEREKRKSEMFPGTRP